MSERLQPMTFPDLVIKIDTTKPLDPDWFNKGYCESLRRESEAIGKWLAYVYGCGSDV